MNPAEVFNTDVTIRPGAARKRGIYVASKTKWANYWKVYREQGYPIISTWIDEAGPGESKDLNDLWQRNITESGNAAALVLYRSLGRPEFAKTFPPDELKGAWIELGSALRSGVPVFAVGIEEFTIAHDKRITHCASPGEAMKLARQCAEAAEQPEPERQPEEPAKSWRCFHCDDVFTSEHEARLHFGADEDATPACKIKGAEGGLLEALRQAESQTAKAWQAIHNETTESARAYHEQQSRHFAQLRAVEETAYERGLNDAKAHPETLGLVTAAQAQQQLADAWEREGKIEAALRAVEYQPGDNPVIPWKLGVFIEAVRAALATPAVQGSLQERVHPWLMACFGPEISADRIERNHRFLEEALELVQACGCTASEAHQLVDYTFNRPMGEPHQEAGGVMITLAALCLANGLDMHKAGEDELARIWTKVEKIRAKQAAKPRHSPLPEV